MRGMRAALDPHWSLVAKFLRQHTHDVCNDLNGLELEAALLGEFVPDGEGAESIARMRAQIRRLAADLRGLAAKFVEPTPVLALYAASELFLIWQEQPSALDPSPAVSWRESVGTEQVNVDASALAEVFRELLANAQAFGTGAPISATVKSEGGRVTFELREPKDAPLEPASWGSQPFAPVRRGHYGLGLWEARRVIAASGGEVERQFEAETMELVTRLSFPVA